MYRSAVVIGLTSDPNSGRRSSWQRGECTWRIRHNQVGSSCDACCRTVAPMPCNRNIVRDPVNYIPIGITRGERVLHVDQTVRHAEDVYTVVPVTDPIADDRHIDGNAELHFIVVKHATVGDLIGEAEPSGTRTISTGAVVSLTLPIV